VPAGKGNPALLERISFSQINRATGKRLREQFVHEEPCEPLPVISSSASAPFPTFVIHLSTL
jgi:hypothetical protein